MVKHNLHGKYIEFKNINSLENIIKSREEIFLDDDEVETIYEKYVNKNKPLPVLFNDTYESVSFRDYNLFVFGITPDGSKTTIKITGIKPYVEIYYEENLTVVENKRRVKKILKSNDISYEKMTITKGKDLMYYSEEEKKYIKIYFNTVKNRKDFINYCCENLIKTFNNELSCYYRLVARQYKFNLSSWNVISNYKKLETEEFKSKYIFEVDINDIKPYDIDSEIEFEHLNMDLFKKDKSISLAYDIEAFISGDINNRIPQNKDDIIFMLCFTAQFINDIDYNLNVCIVCSDCYPQEDVLTIKCKNEKEVIKLFGFFIKQIQPEFITEFNGSQFDWKMIVEKAEYYDILKDLVENMSVRKFNHYELKDNESILKYIVKRECIKIEADRNTFSYNLNTYGFIPFDCRIILQQINSTEKQSSLNFYLHKYKLGQKDDMSIKTMFKYFKENDPQGMKLVAHYCFIDSYSLHKILKKINFIQDRREIARLSYVNMFDGIYRANGSKVRNLIVSQCLSKNLKFSNIVFENEKQKIEGKFPGALVLNPKKGLVHNIYTIQEFNQKQNEKLNEEVINEIQKIINNNYDTIYYDNVIPEEINNLKEFTDIHKEFLEKYIDYLSKNDFTYPIYALDFASLYPSLIMTYNLSPEYLIKLEDKDKYSKLDLHEINFKCNEDDIIAYTVRHQNIQENIGLYPSILIDLFNKRKLMKKKLASFVHQKEQIETTKDKEDYINSKEYNDLIFNITYYNTKQLALKVFMNTFYGETGNQISPLFQLPIAGGITSSGQRNLKFVKSYVETMNYNVYYGDSVVGSTPIIIRINNIIMVKNIRDIGKIIKYSKYNNGKEIKDLTNCNIFVYVKNKWTIIKKVIKHKINKKLYRIKTNSGVVVVTEDHSLLNSNGNIIKPEEIDNNTKLFKWDYLRLPNYSNNFKIFFIYGMILNCGYNYDDCIHFYNNDLDYLNYGMNIWNSINSNNKIVLLFSYERKRFYLELKNCKEFIKFNKNMFVNNSKDKIRITNKIINSDYLCQQYFLNGYLMNKKLETVFCSTQILSQQFYIILRNLGYNIFLSYLNNIFIIKFDLYKKLKNDNKVISIEKINYNDVEYDDYVYDLETENHHFNAGVGNIIVHNTDSLYISPPRKEYDEFDRLYYTNKINKSTYNYKLVEKTFQLSENVKNLVNTHLFNDNGTKYLRMEYEEVLFPVIFLSKKKYYGLPHENTPNFNSNKIFIRGLEVKKRGVSKILIDVCMDIMKRSLSIDNIFTVRELVEKQIDYIFSNNWNMKDFLQDAKYNPEKKNISVNTFIDRMKEINEFIPEPHDRFEYVIVQKDKFDEQGRIRKLIKGDKMEYLENAKKNNNKIDLFYYFEKQIIGQFARLITYDNEFVNEATYDNEVNEDKLYDLCKKYINQISKKYDINNNKGPIYKNLFREVTNNIKKKKLTNDKHLSYILNNNKDYLKNKNNLEIYEFIESLVNSYISNNFNNNIKNNIKMYENKFDSNIKILKLYNNNSSILNSIINELNNKYNKKLNELIVFVNSENIFDKIFKINNIKEMIINKIKEKYDLNNLFINDSSMSLSNFIQLNSIDSVSNDIINSIDINYYSIDEFYKFIIDLSKIKQIINKNENIKKELNYNILKTKNVKQKPYDFHQKYKISNDV